MSRDRKRRLLRILELVASRRIETQEDLASALSGEDWEVTQSSVSRDIRELGLVKIDGAYRKSSRAPKASAPEEAALHDGILLAQRAGDNLVVLHTPTGEAQRVAIALDRASWAEVLGTVAGDDTIFVAVADDRSSRELLRRLERISRRA